MMAITIVSWLLIGFGLYTLTEGYHAFRQRTEDSPPRLQTVDYAGSVLSERTIQRSSAIFCACGK